MSDNLTSKKELHLAKMRSARHPHVTDAEYMERMKSKCIVTESGCWEWQGFRSVSKGMEKHGRTRGYGWMGYRGKNWACHRIAYRCVHGEIPADKIVMHKCDNPPCCNPDHLELGTHKKNMVEAGAKKRWPRQFRETCANGHPRTPENMVRYGRDQKLQCRICLTGNGRKRAGWPKELAYTLPPTPPGHRPVGATWKR